MIDATDMTTPVTRGELRAEITDLEARLDRKLELLEQRLEQKLEQKLEKYATKADLEIWGGALSARIGGLETRTSGVETRLGHVETKVDGLYGELARHTQAILEAMSTQISVVDEKYSDLPERVSRLERDASRSRRR